MVRLAALLALPLRERLPDPGLRPRRRNPPAHSNPSPPTAPRGEPPSNSPPPSPSTRATSTSTPIDVFPHKIYGFDASSPATHTPLGGNFPLSVSEGGSFADLGADPSSHRLYYAAAESFATFAFDATGTEVGGNFPLAGFGCPAAPPSIPRATSGSANCSKARCPSTTPRATRSAR